MIRTVLRRGFQAAGRHEWKHFAMIRSSAMQFSSTSIGLQENVTITFYEEAMDNRVKVTAPVGKRVLDVALENNVDIEGACGGELACSTCHVIVPQNLYDQLPKKKVEEEDMLDLAWGVTDT